MSKVAIVGCGIIGAMIAYELSRVPGLEITVCDRHYPAQAATGAALGVLMGAISQKLKGNNLRMRLSSIQRYNTLIPELEAITGVTLPFNRQGILKLCFAGDDLTVWQKLVEVRRSQGWQLEMLNRADLAFRYPQIQNESLIGAIYSPQDRQLDPSQLTRSLVEAARKNGVTFQFNSPVTQTVCTPADSSNRRVEQIQTKTASLTVDWLVIAAGLGSTPLTAQLERPVDIRPVLGQALQIHCPGLLATGPQPVITGNDIHIVPLENAEYWVGATVEFAGDQSPPMADPASLEQVWQGAITLCPALASATRLRTWSGLRPRPEGRPAPIIEPLPGYNNVLLATGHYRNGILLAPATADAISQAILQHEPASFV